ncbi:STAS/SEC14 domain-containing protein [Methanoplanus endosymbiosus]|uniref:STAS/SEC14 domain-containing protein n=1 Tax=Methanoplanus endosymbiosus TaxID=33865 RepID=A0A9E7PKV4_9EURY|nr:STAS/SEC14 domain-containing protein [Methanoplanus endosymbiosus]UUX91142.1 STAS/SEC14 domain-containing protein [Methanoplanus endosymbiosus]
MITKLPESSGRNVGFMVHGKLTGEDYRETLIPAMEEALKNHEKINILFRMESFRGWTAHAAWDDFVNWPKVRAVRKMAIVFDGEWDEFMSWLFKSMASLFGWKY